MPKLLFTIAVLLPAFLCCGLPASNKVQIATVAPLVGVNQDIIVGDIRWKLLEANDLGSGLPPPSDFQPGLTSSGRFIWIRFEIENRGADETTSYLGVELVDETGRRFAIRSDTASWLDEELCSLKRFNPGVATVCGEIFEVPGDVRGLKLVATDFAVFGSEEALIELETD